MQSIKPWVVGVSGASGMRYALRLLQVLGEHSVPTEVVISSAACRVLLEEEEITFSYARDSAKKLLGKDYPNLHFHSPEDIGASIASGSLKTEGMVIVPCSMFTLAALAHGTGSNLLHRAADVCLKERRRLIVVPRETPLSSIHLENMLKLSTLGVTMVPAMPGFYHKPQSIAELIDSVVMRILDQMSFDIDITSRWKQS